MAIDGSVWLGTSNGKILRFTQGKENTFVSKGVDPTFGTKLAVYTSDNAKNVYVLDSQNNRVVVLDKEGMYLSQYRWKDAVTPSNLVVSEEEKKILLLSGGKIYSIDLK
jgi:DNA-binding beta-propeller fold protein YncE